MQRDAHYYAVLGFCRACGFKKESAQLIAYASQFVDDAKINLMYLSDSPELTDQKDILEYEWVNGRPSFFNMATCHSYYRINTFNYEAMVNNTIAFHFTPGCKGENYTKKLRCQAEGPVIREILEEVLLEDNLIMLGIILHTYADSYTHQGFSGMLSKVNDIHNCEALSDVRLGPFYRILNFLARIGREKYDKLFDLIMPAYGHGQAMDYPDIPYLVWSYQYDESDKFNGSYRKVVRDNREIFKQVFEGLRKHLAHYLKQHPQYLDSGLQFENFTGLMDTLFQADYRRKARETNWQKFLIEQSLFAEEDLRIIIYDETRWLREAFRNYDHKVFANRTVEGVQIATDFLNSNWYEFYLSVKRYKSKFFACCDKYGLSIPN